MRGVYALCLLGALALMGLAMWRRELYLPLSLAMIGLAMLPFFIRFERRRLRAEELLLVAMLGAIAAVSRIPFVALPSVQPVSFIVIMAALVFGAEAGFLVGAIAAIVSNLFLGQGPWTPWQMFSWGMIGFTAGLLRHTRLMGSAWGRAAFGFAWGFLFGWIMNLWGLLGFVGDLSWPAIAASYAASFPFDLAHALSNVVFLALFSGTWLKILGRARRKYGLLDP
ncbi:ECF transporter S component [Paenibacillus albicereus]|uniref:ECF transporter S component n=2 Tax=Paenibacillus albicereus TaxID=2726185 RepID=A0A6H2H4I1_9BACL|nr:ECF transporter S component [Paenibacillus albicereus]